MMSAFGGFKHILKCTADLVLELPRNREKCRNEPNISHIEELESSTVVDDRILFLRCSHASLQLCSSNKSAPIPPQVSTVGLRVFGSKIVVSRTFKLTRSPFRAMIQYITLLPPRDSVE